MFHVIAWHTIVRRVRYSPRTVSARWSGTEFKIRYFLYVSCNYLQYPLYQGLAISSDLAVSLGVSIRLAQSREGKSIIRKPYTSLFILELYNCINIITQKILVEALCKETNVLLRLFYFGLLIRD